MRASGKINYVMVEVSAFIKMDITMKVDGLMINIMVMEG